MLKVKSLRETVRVYLFFTRPMLDWREVHSRFFRMIHEGFGSKLRVQVSEFSGFPAAVTMGDLRARWTIYGGASSVTLFADRIEFDFPVLLPSDYPLAWDILRTVHDLLPRTFDDWQYDRIESQTYEHLEIPASVGVSRYLEAYRRPEVDAAFAGTDAVSQPAIKFKLTSRDESWDCEVVAEKSLFSAAAIFVVRNLAMTKVDPMAPFSDKVMRAQNVAQRCLAALGLEYDSAVSS